MSEVDYVSFDFDMDYSDEDFMEVAGIQGYPVSVPWPPSDPPAIDIATVAPLATEDASETLREVLRGVRHQLGRLRHRSMSSGGSKSGFSYAEVPEWALRQWEKKLKDITE